MKTNRDLNIKPKVDVRNNEHWEKRFKHEEGENDNPSLSFRPMSGSKRAQPHQKINECDH
jgi:hypothetical protein